jgi:hypothetical protein
MVAYDREQRRRETEKETENTGRKDFIYEA